MTYKLSTYSINEIGRRKNQEDCLFPAHGKVTSDDRLFILCDGTGDQMGDRASKAVCQALSKALLLHSTPEGPFSDTILQQAITSAYNALDSIGDVAGDKVGTTLCVLKFHEAGATVAYIGSSRIYHVRPASRKTTAQLLFRSSDPVPGEPNVMMPRQKVRVKVEIAHIQDIQPDDYFFICSDGMLEFIDDEKVLYNLTKPGVNDKDKMNIFSQATLDNKDNHSAMLIHVTKVKGRLSVPGAPSAGGNYLEDMKAFVASMTEMLQSFNGKKLSKKGYYTLLGIVAVLLVILAWLVWPKSSNADENSGDEVTVTDGTDEGASKADEEVSIADFGIDESDDESVDDLFDDSEKKSSEKNADKKSSEKKTEKKSSKKADDKKASDKKSSDKKESKPSKKAEPEQKKAEPAPERVEAPEE